MVNNKCSWKKVGGSKNQYGETFSFKNNSKYVILTGYKTPKDRAIKRWRVQSSTPESLRDLKSFKSKTNAIKFARAYMQKNC